MDPLDYIHPHSIADYQSLTSQLYSKLIAIPHWDTYRALFSQLPSTAEGTLSVSPEGSVVVGSNDTDSTITARLAETLMPWRKGPFHVQGISIDAEWRSNLKWERISSLLGDLGGKDILDVGCGNGYYLFRAINQGAKSGFGLDPVPTFLHQFEFVNHFARAPIHLDLLGAEHLSFFKPAFDIVMCMGVLYHRKDPLGMLESLRSVTKPGGIVVLESITIGTGHTCLFPVDRYAQMRNVWFVPSPDALVSMMRRTGFKDVTLVGTEVTTVDEQRRTQYMQFESLSDFLNQEDPSLTVEGYERPSRTIVIGRN